MDIISARIHYTNSDNSSLSTKISFDKKTELARVWAYSQDTTNKMGK